MAKMLSLTTWAKDDGGGGTERALRRILLERGRILLA